MRAEYITSRYIKAFLDKTGTDSEKTSQYLSGFALLERLFVQKIISNFFLCPVVRRKEKKNLLQLFFSEAQVAIEAQHFLLALLDADRAELMPFLHRVYREEMQKQLHIIPVRVVSAFALSEAEKQVSRQQVQQARVDKSEISFETDASLLGGVVVFVGHLKVDLSLQNKIKQVVNSVRA